MDLLIKVLIISFPFVLSGALYWPVIEDRFMAPEPVVEQSEQVDYLALPERKEVSNSQQVKKTIRQSQSIPQEVPDSRVYRWVDENGNVVFSDRPGSGNAVPHTLIDIGYVEVSDDLKRQALIRAAQVEAIKADLLSQQNTSKGYRAASSSNVAGYEFSQTSAGQKHGYVLLSGRISGGPKCKKLIVHASAKSDMGGSVRSQDKTSYNGFGSALFEMKPRSRWNGSGRRPQWEISNVSANCAE